MDFRNAARTEIRSAQHFLREANRRYPAAMTVVPRDQWPSEFDQGGIIVLGCWRSSQFLAVAYNERPPVIRLTIQRTFLRSDGHWADGITWDELQRIKNECGFADRDAVEVYPSVEHQVNVANLRHLWVLPEPFYLTWRDQWPDMVREGR